MKRVLLAVALIGLGVGGASADVNNLEGGVFIAHHEPALAYSSDTPAEGWCARWLNNYAIHSCEEQNPTIMTEATRVWYLLSAFTENKTWCGSEFGLGQYDPNIYLFTGWGPCTPGNNLEIPSPNWPGPVEGTAIVTTDTPWTGNFQPVYHFIGYAYYAAPGRIPFGIDPPTGFGGWGNCLTPPTSYPAACYPQMGVLMDGVGCCPSVPEFVCCVGEDCMLTTEQQCAGMQGEWHPEWTTCDPNPCAEPRAVCCVGENCYITTQQECTGMQGVWHPDWADCGPPNPCALPRAVCCVSGDCYITTENGCAEMQGEWHADWETCEPNPCPPSPANQRTWGKIKSMYR